MGTPLALMTKMTTTTSCSTNTSSMDYFGARLKRVHIPEGKFRIISYKSSNVSKRGDGEQGQEMSFFDYGIEDSSAEA